MSEPTLAPRPNILARKVNDTPVFNREGISIGQIEDLAIEKKTGIVSYAILSLGGILGIGDKYYPLSWSLLDYDTARNGYRIHLTKEDLSAAPSFSKAELAEVSEIDAGHRQPIHDYYRGFNAPTGL